jgi:hypothetical protein
MSIGRGNQYTEGQLFDELHDPDDETVSNEVSP